MVYLGSVVLKGGRLANDKLPQVLFLIFHTLPNPVRISSGLKQKCLQIYLYQQASLLTDILIWTNYSFFIEIDTSHSTLRTRVRGQTSKTKA